MQEMGSISAVGVSPTKECLVPRDCRDWRKCRLHNKLTLVKDSLSNEMEQDSMALAPHVLCPPSVFEKIFSQRISVIREVRKAVRSKEEQSKETK